MASHGDGLGHEGNADPVTMTRFILREQLSFAKSSGEFSMLLQSIQLACKLIANACKKAGLANLYGIAGDENSSGDQQKKLDVFSDEVFVNCLRSSGQVYIMGTEEREDPIIVKSDDGKKTVHVGRYAVVFDPLDGSSNIDCNVSVGTIFGIYKKDSEEDASDPQLSDLLRPGTDLVAAGYALYGSATMLVMSTGNGVNGFTLDPAAGEFILTNPDMRVPTHGNIYAINEGNSVYWDKATTTFVAQCKTIQEKTGKPKSARYIGSMVADVHRTLLYGGIFCYPSDSKSKSGKLRLLYECNPMSFLMEQAGGKSTTGTRRLLDIVPTKLHERHPIWCGSSADVEAIEALYKEHPSADLPK